MADDPKRYDEVPGGHLYLKAGQVPDQPYTETIAKNRAAKDRELLDSMQATEAAALGAVADLEAKWTTSHVERSTSGRLVFAQSTGTVPVTRTSTGRLVVRA